MNQNRQDITSGDISQRTRDRLGKFDVGVKLGDQFANERHVDRPGHDMNAVGAHVGGELDFAHHHRFLGERGQRANLIFNRHRLRHGRSHATHPGWILDARFIAFLEDIFQQIDHLARVGALQLDELAHHFRRRDINLIHDFDQAPNDSGILRHQQAAGLRECEDRRGVGPGPAQILRERLLELDRIGVTQFEKIADDLIARRDFRFIGNDRHRRRSRILPRADDFDDVALGWHEGKTIQREIHFDDPDRFSPRHRFADENVHLALDEIVHDELFAGKRFVKVQDILDVAVRKLHVRHRVRRARGHIRNHRRRRRGRGNRDLGNWRWPARGDLAENATR